jgi:hypothetical protein
MKNCILLIVLFFSLAVTAQDYPGKKPEILIGKEVKVIPLNSVLGYRDFYTAKTLTYEDVYKPKQAYSSYTDTPVLLNKVFKVAGVERFKMNGNEVILLVLNDSEGKTLYYKFDAESRIDYPFAVVGGLALPKEVYCDYITKFEATYGSEIADGVAFYKEKKKGQPVYYMSVSLSNAAYATGKKGAELQLANNKKIAKPNARVKVDDNGHGEFYYTATLELTAADVALLKANKITGAKIHIYNTEITAGEMLKGIFNCLVTK